MSTLDLTTIVQPILAVIGAAVAAQLAIYLPKAIAAFSARTGIQLTDQQRQTVNSAVYTAAGILETRLDQGALKVAHIEISNPAVLEQARAVVAAVPIAGAAVGLTVDGAARMIVGAVDTVAHGAPAVVAVPAVPVAA